MITIDALRMADVPYQAAEYAVPTVRQRSSSMTEQPTDIRLRWPLPTHDYWSTPFAESLLQHLDLCPGVSILDIASGHGIPAFYLAEQVGPTGQVLAIDLSGNQVESARTIQGDATPMAAIRMFGYACIASARALFRPHHRQSLRYVFPSEPVRSCSGIGGTSQAGRPTGVDLSFARHIRVALASD